MLYKFKYRGIFSEVSIPKNKIKGTIIILPGLPEYPRPKKLMEELSLKGYYVLYPRYRGTFESKGKFLKNSPSRDILEIIKAIKKFKEFKELYNNKKFRINNKNILLLASSFGGSVAIHLLQLTDYIKRAIIFAPVIDYNVHGKKYPEQNLHNLKKFLYLGFPKVYRFDKKDYDRFLKGKVMPSGFNAKKFNSEIILIHGTKDKTVSIKHSKKFAQQFRKNVKFYPVQGLGHDSISALRERGLLKKFFK